MASPGGYTQNGKSASNRTARNRAGGQTARPVAEITATSVPGNLRGFAARRFRSTSWSKLLAFCRGSSGGRMRDFDGATKRTGFAIQVVLTVKVRQSTLRSF